jgi:Domain of unknown function (DUF4345)
MLILLATGIGFLGFGVGATLWPTRTAAVTELLLPTGSARADFTATYGGFQIGFGVYLVACARTAGWLEPGLWAATAALAGFAGTRTFGILRERGHVHGAIWFGLVLELAFLGLNLWALAATSS